MHPKSLQYLNSFINLVEKYFYLAKTIFGHTKLAAYNTEITRRIVQKKRTLMHPQCIKEYCNLILTTRSKILRTPERKALENIVRREEMQVAWNPAFLLSQIASSKTIPTIF